MISISEYLTQIPKREPRKSTHSLETVNQTTIWSVIELAHDIFEANKIFYINDGFIFK